MERRGHKEADVVQRLSLIGRFGTVNEIAKATLWLSSDESSFTFGHIFAVHPLANCDYNIDCEEPAAVLANIASESKPIRLVGTTSMITRPGELSNCTNDRCFSSLPGRTMAARTG